MGILVQTKKGVLVSPGLIQVWQPVCCRPVPYFWDFHRRRVGIESEAAIEFFRLDHAENIATFVRYNMDYTIGGRWKPRRS